MTLAEVSEYSVGMREEREPKCQGGITPGLVIPGFPLELAKFPIRDIFHKVRKGVILVSRSFSMKAHPTLSFLLRCFLCPLQRWCLKSSALRTPLSGPSGLERDTVCWLGEAGGLVLMKFMYLNHVPRLDLDSNILMGHGQD